MTGKYINPFGESLFFLQKTVKRREEKPTPLINNVDKNKQASRILLTSKNNQELGVLSLKN